MELLDHTFLGSPLKDWLIALSLGIGFLVIVRLIKGILARRFMARDQVRHDTVYALVALLVERISMPVIAILAIDMGAAGLKKGDGFQTWMSALSVIAVIVQVTIWGNVLISFALKRYQAKVQNASGERMTTMRALGFVGRFVLLSVATLLALDNIPGVKITTLIASLGIGGIAVAMAVQSILADLFASLSIVLDKPFVIGDFIIVDTHMGTVEYIGLKTTRIRSISGEQLIFANSDLLKSRIRNYKRMAERRVVFTIGVLYQTSHDQLQLIPKIIREAVDARDRTRFDRSHFQGFGDSALNFETVYYVLDPDYSLYMDIQQAINLEIFRRFQEEGISFAYPTRTIFLETGDENAKALGPFVVQAEGSEA